MRKMNEVVKAVVAGILTVLVTVLSQEKEDDR